jgi:hypothetical protein
VHLDRTPWDFSADPLGIGEQERWFDRQFKPHLERTITSPGAWQAQGVGNASTDGFMTHQFQGIGWYRKTVSLADVRHGNYSSVWLWIGGAPGGVMRSAKVWANGVYIGRHIGYIEPLEMNLTDAITSTAADMLTVAVAVDSRWNKTEEALWGGGSFFNQASDGHNFGGYGGMIGHARLLFRQPAWIEDSVHVSTQRVGESDNWTCVVTFAIRGTAVSPTVTLVICPTNSSATQTQQMQGARCISSTAKTFADTGGRLSIASTVPKARLWVPGTRVAQAHLYTLALMLASEPLASPAAILDQKSVRFGFKSLKLDGPKIIYNGERLFLRGFGDDGQYGSSLAPPMDKTFHYKHLLEMRALGFNFIRFHTHTMPDVFFDAADELGFLVNGEFAINYQYPCPFPGCIVNEQVVEVYNRSFTAQVQRQSSHPSVFAYVLANENGFAADATKPHGADAVQFAKMYLFAKAFDPERPCWFADGQFQIKWLTRVGSGCNQPDPCPPELQGDPASSAHALGCTDGRNHSNQWCFADILTTGGWGDMNHGNVDGAPNLPVELPKPAILHEAYDGRMFPRLQVKLDSYRHAVVNGSKWLMPAVDKMRQLGLFQEHAQWAEASEESYSVKMKAYLENYRMGFLTKGELTSGWSGYEWWLGYDWFATSNGLVGGQGNDPRHKAGISNSSLRDVQNEIVLLIPTPIEFQSTGYRAGQTVTTELILANYTFGLYPRWAQAGNLSWSACVEGSAPFLKRSVAVVAGSIPQGTTQRVTNISLTLPKLPPRATVVRLTATIEVGGEIFHNSWTLGVLPLTDATKCPVPVFASEPYLSAAQSVCKNAEPIPSDVDDLPATAFVMLTKMLTADVAAVIHTNGGRALVLNPSTEGSFPVCKESAIGPIGAPGQHSTAHPWWMSGGRVGSLVYNTSLAQLLGVTNRSCFCDFYWLDVMNGALFWTLDDVRPAADAKVLVRSIGTDGSNVGFAGTYVTQLSNDAVVFEGLLPPYGEDGGTPSASAGRFIVSGLNLFSDKIRATPQAQYVFTALVNYAVAEASVVMEANRRNKSHTASILRQTQAKYAAKSLCPVLPSFCRRGHEEVCQQKLEISVASNCMPAFEVVTLVNSMATDSTSSSFAVDALHIRLTTHGAVSLIPVIYNSSASDHIDSLIETGSTVVAPGNQNDSWVKLPLNTSVQLSAGASVWIGVLNSAQFSCFSIPKASGGDGIYAGRKFTAGPATDAKSLSWTDGSGSLAIYASISDGRRVKMVSKPIAAPVLKTDADDALVCGFCASSGALQLFHSSAVSPLSGWRRAEIINTGAGASRAPSNNNCGDDNSTDTCRVSAQQAYIVTLPSADGHGVELVFVGDRWGSSWDGSKGHDFQHWEVLTRSGASNAFVPLKNMSQWSLKSDDSGASTSSAGAFFAAGTPPGVPTDADCALRSLAHRYGEGLSVAARAHSAALHAALQLGACGNPTPAPDRQPPPADTPPPHATATVVEVDPRAGSDRRSIGGTQPFRTIAAAVAFTRTARKPAAVLLHAGTHHLAAPVQLDARDSGLTIQNSPGERAVVSGGRRLQIAAGGWRPASAACGVGCFAADLREQGVAAMAGLRRDGVREIRARYPDFDAEFGGVTGSPALVHDGVDGWVHAGTSWVCAAAHTAMNGIDGPWPPTRPAETHLSNASDWPNVAAAGGWPMHILTAGRPDPDGSSEPGLPAVGSDGEGDHGNFWIGTGGTCVDRAPPAGYWCAPKAPRDIGVPDHPLGVYIDAEYLPNAPARGYKAVDGAVVHGWRSGHWYTNMYEVRSQAGSEAGDSVTTVWQTYQNVNNVYGRVGVDKHVHLLGVFNSSRECFAAANASQLAIHAWTFYTVNPTGDPSFSGKCYGDTGGRWNNVPDGNCVSGLAPGKRVEMRNKSLHLVFRRGGTQGGEGACFNSGTGSPMTAAGEDVWYIENVLEELTSAREWFYDKSAQLLYYKPANVTDAKELDAIEFVATQSRVLFNISGSMASPVRGLSFRGLTFRDTALSFFEEHSLPSGGDWAIAPQGALTIEGTVGTTIDGCNFTRLDGNAIFATNFNRGLTIANSSFELIGESCIALFGRTSRNLTEDGSRRLAYPLGPDGRGGDQPRGTLIEGNVARELALWQKQSAFVFQAVAAQTTIRRNAAWNMPRAAINFNGRPHHFLVVLRAVAPF